MEFATESIYTSLYPQVKHNTKSTLEPAREILVFITYDICITSLQLRTVSPECVFYNDATTSLP